MPEWYLIIAALSLLSLIGLKWAPLLWMLPLLGLAVVVPVVQAIRSSRQAIFDEESRSSTGLFKLRGITALLHILQPIARLYGRLSAGLTPWRRRGSHKFSLPRPRKNSIWSESWSAPEKRLESIEMLLKNIGSIVRRGGYFDRWDLEIRGGLFSSLRILMGIEEHGGGKQMVHLHSWPKLNYFSLLLIAIFGSLAIIAGFDGAVFAAATLGFITFLIISQLIIDCSFATSSYLKALGSQDIKLS